MYRDEVCIGSQNKICLENFLFLSAYHLSEDPFKDVDFDGIIGLGFSELSMSPESNFLENLLYKKKITNKIFSFFFRKKFFPVQKNKNYMNKNDKKNNRNINENKNTQLSPISTYPDKNIIKSNDNDNNNNSNNFYYDKSMQKNLSELVIGGIDFSRIKGDIFFSDIISKKYWEINLDNIYYGRTKLPFCHNKKCTAIVDTGTSTLGVSDNFLRLFKKLANLEKNCSNLNNLRPLIFEINGIFFELDPKDYVLKFRLNGLNDFEYMIPDDKVEEK